LAEQEGRQLLEDLSKGLLISLLDLALTLGLTALFLKLRRKPLISVMKSDSLGPILTSSLLFFPFLLTVDKGGEV
jgi:hypothetical protein